MRTILYNVTPSDPLSVGLIAAFVVLATMASYLPPRHAMAVDPIIVLRNE